MNSTLLSLISSWSISSASPSFYVIFCGNVHVYDYYRCTHKNKNVACKEPHIRAEELDKQLSNLLLDFAMPTKSASISKAQEQIVQLSSKLQLLFDGYLDGDVERELYQTKRADILSEKKRLQEKSSNLHLAF